MLHFHFYMVRFADGTVRLMRVPVVVGESPYMPEILDASGRWIAPAFIGEYTILNEVFPMAPINSSPVAMVGSGHETEMLEPVLASGEPTVDVVLAGVGSGGTTFPLS